MLTDGEEQVDVVGAHVVLGQVDDGALEGHLAVVVGGHLENSNIRKSSREIKIYHRYLMMNYMILDVTFEILLYV